jgi:hypothetical protein
LDDGNLLAELDSVTTTTDLNVSLEKSEMRDKAGVDAETLAKKWGIGIEADKMTRIMNTQRWDKNNDSPKSDKAIQNQ